MNSCNHSYWRLSVISTTRNYTDPFDSWGQRVGNDNLNIIGDSYGKGVSDLKACLDYCEDPVRSCEKWFSCTKQNRSTDWEVSVVTSLPKLFWEVAWFFHHVIWRQMGGKIQMFTTSCRILAIIHPHFLKFLGLYLEKQGS